MSLKAYQDKRNFAQTPEPNEERPAVKPDKLIFVIQRHEASTLHYDFRLQMEGVLKSWAVPKGPSLNPADKRLAIMVEDHPFSYHTFEGDIPAGNYGAGHVAIWDQGTYYALNNANKATSEQELLQGLQNGSFTFFLEGSKIKGAYSLVKMKGRQKNAWLLLKQADEFAVTEPYNSEDYIAGKNPSSPNAGSSPKSLRKTEPAKENTTKTDFVAPPKTEPPREVPLSNLSKVYWPTENITKGDLIEYYQTIAETILPYLQDRPESLLRHPNGIQTPGFFQKDAGDQAPAWIQTAAIHSESTNEEVNYLVCQNKETLAYLNNLGCIQLNPWNSRLQHLTKPDYLVLDLDPGENTYDQVIEVALATKEILDQANVIAYCKTSGATGMHIFVPLAAKYDFAPVKELAQALAQKVHQQLPSLTSLERNPKERRYQIYLDFLQNAISQTIAAPYSVRPKPGAPVSAPLRWEEVKPGLQPTQFMLRNMPDRLKKEGDLFKGVLGPGIDLAKALQALKS